MVLFPVCSSRGVQKPYLCFSPLLVFCFRFRQHFPLRKKAEVVSFHPLNLGGSGRADLIGVEGRRLVDDSPREEEANLDIYFRKKKQLFSVYLENCVLVYTSQKHAI